MPRKRKPKFAEYKVPAVDPNDRDAVEDRDLVRHALAGLDAISVLPGETRERLVEDLVEAIRFWRAGVRCRKRGLSDEKEAQHIFMADVARALRRAGLPATRWRKTYEGDGPDARAPESFLFRLSRELAVTCGQTLPNDLKLAGQRASQIEYGVMSEAMKAAQAVGPALHPAGVWGVSLVDAPRSRDELASAHLGFSF
jgi:hypothetical protein